LTSRDFYVHETNDNYFYLNIVLSIYISGYVRIRT